MSRLVTVLRFVIPASTRIWVRAQHRRLVFEQAWKRLEALNNLDEVDSQTLKMLVYGWGNETWAASPGFLKGILHCIAIGQGDIVECGSGLSTLVAGLAAQRAKRTLLSLEADQQWASKMREICAERRITSAKVVHAPLTSSGEKGWYDIATTTLPTDVGLVICDGPPNPEEGSTIRYWALPKLHSVMRNGCIVLLDDLIRVGEQEVVARWRDEYSATHTIHGEGLKLFAEVHLP